MKTKSTLPPHLAEIYTMVVETFGTKSKADYWLNAYHPILENAPMAEAEAASGVIEVKKLLSTISHEGVV